MPRVPLPQVTQDPSRTQLATGAGPVQPMADARPQQLEQLGKATAAFGAGISKVADAVQDDIDEAVVKDRAALLSDGYRRALQDPERGAYLNKLGRDAVEGRKAALDELTRVRKELEGSFDNQRQRDAFSRVAAQATMQAEGHIDAHYGQQAKAYNISRTDSLATARQRDWVMNGDEASKGAMLGQLDELGKLTGEDEATTANKKLKALSQGYEDIIGRTLRIDAVGAQRMLDDAVKAKQIDPDTEQRLREQLATKTANDVGQRVADELTAPKPVPPTADGKPRSWSESFHIDEDQRRQSAIDARAEISRRFHLPANDPLHLTIEQHDAALARVNHGENQRLQENKDAADAVLKEGQRWLNANPRAGLNDLQQQDPQLWQRGLAFDMTDNWAAFSKNRNIATDPKADAWFHSLTKDQLAEMDPEEFALRHFSEFAPETLSRYQKLIQIANGKTTPDAAQTKLIEEAIDHTMLELGIDPSPKPTDDNGQTLASNFRFNAHQTLANSRNKDYLAVLKEMKEAPLSASGINVFALSDKQQGEALTKDPRTGGMIPLKNLGGMQRVLEVRSAIRRANVERMKLGQALIPDTFEEAVRQLVTERNSQLEADTASALASISAVTPGQVQTNKGETLVTPIAAAAATGLTEEQVIATLGSNFWAGTGLSPNSGGLVGLDNGGRYPKDALLRLIDQQRTAGNPLPTPAQVQKNLDDLLRAQFDRRAGIADLPKDRTGAQQNAIPVESAVRALRTVMPTYSEKDLRGALEGAYGSRIIQGPEYVGTGPVELRRDSLVPVDDVREIYVQLATNTQTVGQPWLRRSPVWARESRVGPEPGPYFREAIKLGAQAPR